MDIKEYYTIGEVATICNINIRTLHYYDEIGLLTPDKIDDKSHYRYYSYCQLEEVMIIKEFKFIGFSLKEVKTLLERDDIEYNKKMLALKCEQIDKNIQSLSLLKERLEQHVAFIEKRSFIDEEDFYIKEVKIEYIAYLDCQIPCNFETINTKFIELISLIGKNNLEITGDRYAIFKDNLEIIDYNHANVRLFIPIKEGVHINGLVDTIPTHLALAMTYRGSYTNLDKKYHELCEYAKQHQIKLQGEMINHFIIDRSLAKNEKEFITELMFNIV